MTDPALRRGIPSAAIVRRHNGVLTVLCLGLVVVTTQTSILTTALPTLARELTATDSELQWIMDSYILSFAGVLFIGGSLADRFGRRRIMELGLVTCGVCAVTAALSQDAMLLVASRAAMGIGAALTVPATLSILVSVFTEPRERSRAIATWTLMNAIGAFVGPIAGGVLLLWLPWQSCFYITLPIIAGTIVLSRRYVEFDRSNDPVAFDLIGSALSAGALSSLVWAIIEGAEMGWTSIPVVSVFVIAAALTAAFVKWESRAKHPVLDLSMFRSRQLSGATVALGVAFLAMTGTMYLAQLGLQLGKGYSPLGAALAVSVPVTIVNLLVVPRAPWLIDRLGLRAMIGGGMAVIALSSLVIATMTRTSGYMPLAIGFALMALAFSTIAPASTEAIMSAVPAERSGGASALSQLTRQVAQALAIAAGGGIAAEQYRSRLDLPEDSLSPEASARALSSFSEALNVASYMSGAARDAFLVAARDAYLLGIRVALVCAAAAALAGACYTLFAIPGRPQRGERSTSR